jgi:hypothetical protein
MNWLMMNSKPQSKYYLNAEKRRFDFKQTPKTHKILKAAEKHNELEEIMSSKKIMTCNQIPRILQFLQHFDVCGVSFNMHNME